MIRLTTTGPYTAKDQLKANIATKFIGRGSARSSTNSYARDFGPLANYGEYESEDVVFISAEGSRGGRFPPDLIELAKATRSGATFVTDTQANRLRAYNVGEREVAAFLRTKGYTETEEASYSLWSSRATLSK